MNYFNLTFINILKGDINLEGTENGINDGPSLLISRFLTSLLISFLLNTLCSVGINLDFFFAFDTVVVLVALVTIEISEFGEQSNSGISDKSTTVLLIKNKNE